MFSLNPIKNTFSKSKGSNIVCIFYSYLVFIDFLLIYIVWILTEIVGTSSLSISEGLIPII